MTAGRKTRLQALGDLCAPDDSSAVATTVALVRLVGKMSLAMARLVEPHGLTLSGFEVLVNLDDEEGVCQQQLSDRLLFTKGNICVIVHKMELAGLIERRADPHDGRAYRLFVTPQGRCLLAKIRPARVALMERALGGLNAAEQETLRGLLARADEAFNPLEE